MGNQQTTTEYRERLGRNKMVMDRLRRSLRDSFRRRKDHVPQCSKPHQWQADEAAVRAGTCNFQIKYLGCVEVFESRGMQICEEALKVLRNSRRRPIKGTLYVTGDGLRVVDDETKGLIVDQTIEKVSFCAPDRNHDKGFSYICRDGTTRRWMCHGFLSIRDSGERLSHAVGCAFAVCLEKKQKRDKETVMMNFDPKTSSFTRTGSFRQTTLTERMQDPQDCKPADPPPLKQVHNPHAIERPHATVNMLQRQGSFRGFSALNQTSPFKRQLSLRVNDLPSNLERQRAMSLESGELLIRSNGPSVAPIPESSPISEKTDTISAMCQQVSQGLSLLTSNESIFHSQQNHHTHQLNATENPWSGDTGSRNVSFTQDSNVDLPKSSSNPTDIFADVAPTNPAQQPVVPPRRSSPNFSHLRSQSLGSADAFPTAGKASFDLAHGVVTNGTGCYNKDPFDAEWAALAIQQKQASTNPFAQSSVKTFEVQM